MPAANERFGATAAITPLKILCEIARYYPAERLVPAATSQSRWDVVSNVRRTARRDFAAENRNTAHNGMRFDNRRVQKK